MFVKDSLSRPPRISGCIRILTYTETKKVSQRLMMGVVLDKMMERSTQTSIGIHLTVLHLYVCLFRLKPYPMRFVDQILKNLNGVPLR